MGQGRPQPSFTAGELSPSLYGRIDFAKFYTGLKTCRNFIVSKTGGVYNRPGTEYLGQAHDMTKRVRLIPFQFSASQQYVIEFGHLYARIWFNGALVVDGSNNSIVVTTPYNSLDTMLAADIDLIKYVQSADIITLCHQAYQPQQMARASATSWTLTPFANKNGPFQELNSDQAKTIAVNGTSGAITITAVADIFVAGQVGLLMYLKQMPQDSTPVWQVQIGVGLNTVYKYGANYYRAKNAGTTGTAPPIHTEGTTTDGAVLWEYLHSGFGIVEITGFTDTKHVSASVQSYIPDNIMNAALPKNITNVVGVQTSDGGTPPTYSYTAANITCPNHGYTSGQTVVIANVGGATQVNGTWSNITVLGVDTFQISSAFGASFTAYTSGGTAALSVTTGAPTYLWAFSAWGNDQGYPQTTGYYQQRQLFAGTPAQPQTSWFSTVRGYNDFSSAIPSLDTDAMTYTVFSTQVNEIRHILETTSLVLFTSVGPFIIPGNTGSTTTVATPGNITFKKQGANACALYPAPLPINYFALFVQDKGNQVRSLGYSFQQDSFIGQDVTVMSDHLFKNHQIVDWCYQEIPNNCVWAVREDGTLLGFTFLPEQEVSAWHRHDTAFGYFESVCCITENNQDVVYCAVKRTVNGQPVRYIERFDPRTFADVKDAWFVDAGLNYTGAAVTTLTGLDHLEGMMVSILADGLVHPQRVVSGGAVTLEYAASNVTVGLPIQADVETLEIKEWDKKRIINFVSLLVAESSGLWVGPDADHLFQQKQIRTDYSSPPALLNGEVDVSIQGSWQKQGRVFVRQNDPLPITILSICPDVTVGGR